jgi:hypothetical protein
MDTREAIRAEIGPDTLLNIGTPSGVTTKAHACLQADLILSLDNRGSVDQRLKAPSSLLNTSVRGSTLKANLMAVVAHLPVDEMPEAAATCVRKDCNLDGEVPVASIPQNATA